MKGLPLFFLLQALTGNPLLALLSVLIVYVLIDRRYIGILPDFLIPLRRRKRIVELKREVQLNPYQGLAFYELGMLLVEKGNMKEGVVCLEKAKTLMPDHPDAQYYLGVAYIKSGQLEEGKKALEEALRLNPKVKYGAPYIYLIEYLLKKGTVDEKIDEYIEKVKMYGSPEYYYRLGLLFQKARRRKEAKEMFAAAVANFQKYPSFYRKQHRYWAFRARLRSLLR